MKVNILFTFKEGAAGGGGNQFLKTLRDYLRKSNNYCENVKDADVVLFNSYQYIDSVLKSKKEFPTKVFIHRIDGPISLYNKKNDGRDRITNLANKLLADGTIFQSDWSKNKNKNFGLKSNFFETVISNTCDSKIFNTIGKSTFFPDQKIKLIATSWSSNYNKGFEVYKWIDENLDFKKFEMVFIGNSPINFKNIKKLPPLPAQLLAVELKKSDIYLTASKNDPCSNAVIEALNCGLPVVALRDGGHPEIIGDGGLYFNNHIELPEILHSMVENYYHICSNIKTKNFEEVEAQYYTFFKKILDAVENKQYSIKKINIYSYYRMMISLFLWRFNNCIQTYCTSKRTDLL